jgi:hypothetical protein
MHTAFFSPSKRTEELKRNEKQKQKKMGAKNRTLTYMHINIRFCALFFTKEGEMGRKKQARLDIPSEIYNLRSLDDYNDDDEGKKEREEKKYYYVI